ncbi:FAD-dependent oxidoreductase [Rhodocaloribacter litoris]|uniref:NAD(P)/FAD-dependent oxidoreductase n=1 Tax=Rhodocaloribacter litoris TaxID=2558931 RepID=UPI0014207021|nr:FAD-dependent oxidoreductase [Rhodocaloribacter litoris]QXD15369.1 FAD-dependent oxidoreductase [Rhodocaloribacter litoris]
MQRTHIVIVGNGITGITTARFVRKWSNHRITVISAESDHFYSRPALMYLYMGHLTYAQTKPYDDGFWERNDIELLRDYVRSIDTEARRLHLSSGNTLHYDRLVLATGSKSNRFGWPGEDLDGVQGLYGLQDLERMERNTRGIERAVVVGGGLIGVEMAEMLHSRGIQVTFLVRERSYMDYLLPPEESEMVNRHLCRHGIDLRLSTELREILPDEAGRVRAVVTTGGEEIPCRFVGLAVGVHPNVDVTEGSGIETNRGILVNTYFETNVPGVYAAGDCAEFREPPPGRKRIEQLWYTGRMHGYTLARTLCGERTPYRPGVFFNSAKFFDIEYQTYGDVAPVPREGEETLFWQHPSGDKSIRINFRRDDHRVLGFNLMGVRYRHEVCAGWIRQRRPMPYVLAHLGAANFDPEFFARYERELVAQYNARYPDRAVRLKKKKGLWASLTT